MKLIVQPTLADSICDLRRKKIKQQFFEQMNTLIDWDRLSAIIDQHHPRGKSATGKPSYNSLLLFKMMLLGTWYGLSDYDVEERVNDSLSFSYFCGLNIEETSPDHSTLCRFRNGLLRTGGLAPLMTEVNRQLEQSGILVKTGAMVDASVINTPLRPKGKSRHEVAEDRAEPADGKEVPEREKKYADSVDADGTWLKKAGKTYFGYKKHYVSNDDGLVMGIVTTTANVNEIANLGEVLDAADLPRGIPLKADKGYQSRKNRQLLKDRGIKDHIMKKAVRGRPLTAWEIKFNKLVGKTRFRIERTFGSIKRWFGGGTARYRGMEKMHGQNIMEALAYNLYRSPGIVMCNSQIIG